MAAGPRGPRAVHTTWYHVDVPGRRDASRPMPRRAALGFLVALSPLQLGTCRPAGQDQFPRLVCHPLAAPCATKQSDAMSCAYSGCCWLNDTNSGTQEISACDGSPFPF